MLSMTSLEREKFLILDAIFLICFFTLSVSASCDSSSFYASIPELSDGKPTTRTSWESILSQLNELLENTHNTVPYTSTNTDVWDALRVLDQDPSNSSNVWLLYANRSEPFSSKGLSTGWNREHLVPRSYGLGENGPDFSDLHNLRAEDANVNSARNNLYYDNCYPSKDASCQQPAHVEAGQDTAKNSYHFMPPENVKGDIARGVFYMALRYNGSINTEKNIRLGDCPCVLDYVFGNLTTLLQWSKDDEISDGEMMRNNLTCALFQNNRNPFVDFDWLQEAFFVEPALPLLKSDCSSDYGGDPDDCSDTADATATPTILPTVSVLTDISTGGVVVIGINTDNPDSFALLALEHINAGSVLYVTDKGYDGSAFRSSEGVLAFAVTARIPAGSTWLYEDGSTLANEFGEWSMVEGSFLLSTSGDQLFVFTDSIDNPKFIFGVSNSWELNGSDLSATTTTLPVSLNESDAFLTVGNSDNARYSGITSATRSNLMSNVTSISEWVTSSSSMFSMTFEKFDVIDSVTCLSISVEYF